MRIAAVAMIVICVGITLAGCVNRDEPTVIATEEPASVHRAFQGLAPQASFLTMEIRNTTTFEFDVTVQGAQDIGRARWLRYQLIDLTTYELVLGGIHDTYVDLVSVESDAGPIPVHGSAGLEALYQLQVEGDEMSFRLASVKPIDIPEPALFMVAFWPPYEEAQWRVEIGTPAVGSNMTIGPGCGQVFSGDWGEGTDTMLGRRAYARVGGEFSLQANGTLFLWPELPQDGASRYWLETPSDLMHVYDDTDEALTPPRTSDTVPWDGGVFVSNETGRYTFGIDKVAGFARSGAIRWCDIDPGHRIDTSAAAVEEDAAAAKTN